MDVMSLEEYKSLFNWLLQSYDKGLDEDFKYSFGVFLKLGDTRKFIGWVGVGGLEFQPADKEIYYLIGRDYWGNGFASETVAAFVHYCFHVMKLHRIVAKVDPGNIASKRIIEKSGFTFKYVLNNLPLQYCECNGELLYALTDDEYASMH